MRIEELYLDGFGHFHQRNIGPLLGPVSVFLGPNEAGKSTTLAFIRAVLFGFPTQFRRHYPPLAGGNHGGRITVSDGAGSIYQVERYAGARGGLAIATPGGPASNPEALMQRLTGSATPDLFRNVFAFSLDELQAAASLNDSSGTIYSAGQGAPGLPDLRKSLGERKSRLYLARGNNQEVPRLITSLREVDARLKEVERNADRYGHLTTRRSEIDAELEQADVELASLGTKRARIGRLLTGWEDWISLTDCETRLGDLPAFDGFPEEPLPRLEQAQQRIQQALEARDEVAGQLRRLNEIADTLIPDEDLLYDASSIEAIRRDRNRFDAAVKDLPERRAELNALESELLDRLQELGPDWDEQRIQEFDASIAFRQEVEQGRDNLADKQNAVRTAEDRLAQERRTLVDCENAVTEASDRMPDDQPPLNSAALGQQRAALRAARGRLDEYERARRSHEDLRYLLDSTETEQEAPPAANPLSAWFAPLFIAVVGIALLVGGLFVGGMATVLVVVAGIVLLAMAAFTGLRGRTPTAPVVNPMAAPMARRAEQARESAESAWRLLEDATSTLAVGGDPSSATLDNAEERLDAAQATLSAWNDAREKLAEAQRHLRSQEQRVETSAFGLRGASELYEEASGNWRGWLQHRGLPVTFTPDTVMEFAGRVETARVKLEQVRENRRRVSAIEDDIEEFRALVAPLSSRHGMTLDEGNRSQLAPAADELIRRFDATQAAYSDRERAREQGEEVRLQLESREQGLQSAQEDLASLLESGGTDDVEEFRRRARQLAQRLELERQRDEHRRALERLSGPGQQFDAFREALTSADPAALEEESVRLSELHAEVEDRRDTLREERGGIATELEQLVSEEESSALRIRKSTLEEQLQENAREWSRLTIAESLLERTSQKFEQERQPSVIRHAQDFFASVTGDRYQRLYAPIGEQTVTVTDSAGASKQPGELSRGTREQLYLALRFGLIREFGEHAECLPVVVDEALVNFDPRRARLAADSFAQLSETNQVLVFTCHPGTAEMFADAAGAQVVDIGG